MTTNKLPTPPKTLSKSSAEYWTKFCDTYETDESILAVLFAVCQNLDRASEAAAGIKTTGLTVLDRFGCTRANPLCMIERQANAAAINGIKALGVLKNDTSEDRYSNKVF